MRTYLNDQEGTECQLITSINASVFFGYPLIHSKSKKFNEYVRRVACDTGSAIGISNLDGELGIRRYKISFRKRNFNFIRKKLSSRNPVEISVSHPDHHLHSVLLIDVKKKENQWYVRALNFKGITEHTGGWVKWEEIEEFWIPNTRLQFHWFEKI